MPSQAPSITHHRRVLYRSDNCCILFRLWQTAH
nr:MAG TPA: hypothetical protein [Caudoviricetes sp.]